MTARRLAAVTSIIVAMLCMTAQPSYAVINGEPDNERTFVGLLFVDGQPLCSSVLISATVLATASHCTTAAADVGGEVRVTFDATPDDQSKFYSSSSIASHPSAEVPPITDSDTFDFNHIRNDLGAVVLDTPVTEVEPATIPRLGAAGEIVWHKFTPLIVGYGAKGYSPDGELIGGPVERTSAHLEYSAHNNDYLVLGNEQFAGCKGDSGGPILRGDEVLALTTGGRDCRSAGFYTRFDTWQAQSFYSQFL